MSGWKLQEMAMGCENFSFHPHAQQKLFYFQADGATFSFPVMVIGTARKPDNRLLKFLCADWKSTL